MSRREAHRRRVEWGKVAMVVIDVLLAVYLVVAVVAFNRPETGAVLCSTVSISVTDGSDNGFVDAAEVKRRLVAEGLYPIGCPVDEVMSRRIEEHLKESPFVRTAECYKTVSGAVIIDVTQLKPVIRIKASDGDDYYVDDKNSVMPKSDYVSDLIIATGAISRSYATNSLATLGRTLMGNAVWASLVEQIHVNADRTVDLVPRVGDHIVHLGALPATPASQDGGRAVEEFACRKMRMLEHFYRYGLSAAGWNKYSYIDIEFDNQIICRRRSQRASASQ